MDRTSGIAQRSVHESATTASVDRNSCLATLAARQRGLLTTAQLLDVGLTRSAISCRLAAGTLHRLHRGVYLLGHTAAAPLAYELAALLACGPTAALSHWTAAALQRILAHTDGPIHLTIPDRRCRPRPGVQPRFASLPDQEVTTRHGLRITTPLRTLQDLRPLLDPAAYERAVNEAQVLHLIPKQSDGPGITREEAERRLKHLLKRAQLRPTATNTTIRGHEVDAFFQDPKLIVEVDGYSTHGTRLAFENDRRRDAELTGAGYRVMRVTWRQIEEEPEAVAARLGAAIASSSP
jgi:very-short-patch-repair endonuclease